MFVYFLLFSFSGFSYVAFFLQYFDTVVCWLGVLICKSVSQITYTVLVETLNPAQCNPYSINMCVCVGDREGVEYGGPGTYQGERRQGDDTATETGD